MKYEISNMVGKIIHADCSDVLKQLGDKSVDLVLTDPPYGIGMGGNHQIKSLPNSPKWSGCKYPVETWDSTRPCKYVFDAMRRVSKHQIVWGGNYFTDYLPVKKGWLFWDKKMSHNNNFSHGELAWTSSDSILRMYSFSATGIGFSGEKYHPTQKPVPLFVWCLLNYSKPGDLILDPFCGSGTTALACHKTGRRFVCIDREPKYIEIAKRRYRDFTAQQDLFCAENMEANKTAANTPMQLSAFGTEPEAPSA